MAAIWGGLVIAPAMAAGFGAVVFLLVKYIVLKRRDSTRWGIITGPFWFFLVACVLTMSISTFAYAKTPGTELLHLSLSLQRLAAIDIGRDVIRQDGRRHSPHWIGG